MSDEFKIHHLASQVCSSLKSSIKPDNIASTFSKNRTRYVTVQVPAQEARRLIISQSSTPHEFNDLYDELKSKNVRVLDGLVFILENICKDDKLKKMLHAHALNIGDAAKIPIGKVKLGGARQEKQDLASVDLEAIQKTISESARKSRRSKTHSSLKKLEQGDSAVSADTLLDVKAQRMKAEANESSTCDIRYPAIWRSRHIPDLEQYINKPVGQIGALPTESQESELVRDLLFILTGGRATFMWMKKSSTEEHRIVAPEYELDPSINISLRSLTVEPLKVASALHVIINFSERYVLHNYGLVAHALVAELSNYVQEIRNNMVKLESVHITSGLNLHQLNCHLRSVLRQVQIISDICQTIARSNSRGAQILTILHQKTENSAGDPEQRIIFNLTAAACAPYLDMIARWVQKGELQDKYREFMVTIRKDHGKENLQIEYHENYWEQHASLVRERIPRFLEDYAEKILKTGKYLNVVAECGHDIAHRHEPLKYLANPRLLEKPINTCYNHSSQLLVTMLMKDYNLVGRLRSVKRFFLLDQSDFLDQFIDLADEDLRRPVSKTVQSRLQASLEMAIRTSTADRDLYKDDVRIVLAPTDLITQLMRIISIDSKDTAAVKKLNPTDEGLSCLEAISFDYVVKWPLSLIISRKKLVPYQLLFRFLFYTKYIEWILNNTWRYASELTKRFRVADDKSHEAFILRHRMLIFVQHLQSYITFGVIEPQWKVFMETLAKVQNVDEVLNAHSRFLENCLRSGQLSTKDIFRIIHKILLVVSQFVNFLNQTYAQVEQLSALIGTSDYDESMDRLFGCHFQEQVRLHDKSFSDKIRKLIVELENIQTKETSDSIMNLLLKLDFNRYYSGQVAATLRS